jgi:hypothetical protein
MAAEPARQHHPVSPPLPALPQSARPAAGAASPPAEPPAPRSRAGSYDGPDVSRREEALKAQEQRLAALQEKQARGAAAPGSAPESAPESARGSMDVEQLADLTRGVGREPGAGSRGGSPGKGARKPRAPKGGGVLLREVSARLEGFRGEVAADMSRLDAVMKGLGAP